MRYKLIPGPGGCPQNLVDNLNAALDTPSARRVFHAAKSAYRPHKDYSKRSFLAYLKKSTRLPVEELEVILERASLGFHEAMLLPVLFDMTYRCEPTSEPHSERS